MFLEVLLPTKCPVCLKTRGDTVCEKCAKTIVAADPPEREIGGFIVFSPFVYTSNIARAIKRLKFRDGLQSAEFFAASICEILPKNARFDCVSYAPLPILRDWRRGYNQAKILASAVAERLQTPLNPTLSKRYARPQTTLKSREERRENVSNAYRAKRGVFGKNILLIDDICTTGATLSACRETLKNAGAASVLCATAARTR